MNRPFTGAQVRELPKGMTPNFYPNRRARRAHMQSQPGNNRKATPGRQKQYIEIMSLASYGPKGLNIMEVSTGKQKLVRHNRMFHAY